MPYVARDQSGVVYGIWANEQWPGQEWLPDDHVDLLVKSPEEIAAEAAATKQAMLDAITVTTTNGNTFDGDETARNNMVSAIMSADVAGQTETAWKLADNSVVVVGLPELKEALMLSIQAVGAIVLA